MRTLLAIVTILSGAAVSAFTPGLHPARLVVTVPVASPRALPTLTTLTPTPSLVVLFMADYDDSSPSDSSDDSQFTIVTTVAASTIDVDNKPSTASESVVSTIMDYLPSSLATSGQISASDRASINEAILRLEALNPTKDPA
jgi:hypothetical protein